MKTDLSLITQRIESLNAWTAIIYSSIMREVTLFMHGHFDHQLADFPRSWSGLTAED